MAEPVAAPTRKDAVDDGKSEAWQVSRARSLTYSRNEAAVLALQKLLLPSIEKMATPPMRKGKGKGKGKRRRKGKGKGRQAREPSTLAVEARGHLIVFAAHVQGDPNPDQEWFGYPIAFGPTDSSHGYVNTVEFTHYYVSATDKVLKFKEPKFEEHELCGASYPYWRFIHEDGYEEFFEHDEEGNSIRYRGMPLVRNVACPDCSARDLVVVTAPGNGGFSFCPVCHAGQCNFVGQRYYPGEGLRRSRQAKTEAAAGIAIASAPPAIDCRRATRSRKKAMDADAAAASTELALAAQQEAADSDYEYCGCRLSDYDDEEDDDDGGAGKSSRNAIQGPVRPPLGYWMPEPVQDTGGFAFTACPLRG